MTQESSTNPPEQSLIWESPDNIEIVATGYANVELVVHSSPGLGKDGKACRLDLRLPEEVLLEHVFENGVGKATITAPSPSGFISSWLTAKTRKRILVDLYISDDIVAGLDLTLQVPSESTIRFPEAFKSTFGSILLKSGIEKFKLTASPMGLRTLNGDIIISEPISAEEFKVDGKVCDAKIHDVLAESIDIKVSLGKVITGKLFSDSLNVDISTGTFKSGDLVIKNGATLDIRMGSIDSDNVLVGSFNAKVSTGSVNVKNVDANNVTASVQMGDANFGDIRVAGPFEVNASMGSIGFKDLISTSTVSAKVSMGSITGQAVQSKSCDITTSMGSINLKDLTAHRATLTTSMGDITVSGKLEVDKFVSSKDVKSK